MATLYALLQDTNETAMGATFIEVVNLDSMTLHTVIPLGQGYPTAFAVSQAQQRIYVVDPSLVEVHVYDTAGPLVGKIALRSAPYDCVLTGDGSRLIISTQVGLASIDTKSLTVTAAVQGPFSQSKDDMISPAWLKGSAALALSGDSNEVAVSYGAISPSAPKAPPDSWLVNAKTLKTTKSFGPPAANWWLYVYDVAYANDQHLILFLASFGVVVALDPTTGELASWTTLVDGATSPCLNSLVYSPATSRAYVTTGYATPLGIFTPYLWIVDPVGGTAQQIEGFNGAPSRACVHDSSQSVYVAVRRPELQDQNDTLTYLPDRLARYDALNAFVEPDLYEFSRNLSVIAMQTTAGSLFDPGVCGLEGAHAEQSVQVLIGLIGGGGGWVITPRGIIKPVDPAPIHVTASSVEDVLGRVFRAGLVARAADSIPDEATRSVVRNNALEFARQQLTALNLRRG